MGRKYSNKKGRLGRRFVHRMKENGKETTRRERQKPEAVSKTQREVLGTAREERLFGKRVTVMHSD